MRLEKRFTTPDHWQWDYFNCPDRTDSYGHKIRFGFCRAAKPKALVVIAPGRTQTSEEYFEFARDMMKRHFSVAVIDWQGQGGSYRFNDDDTRQHSVGFDYDVHDFELFLKQLDRIDEFQTLPRVLVAHSMGGHISLRHMVAYPDPFLCGVMIAPMLEIKIPLFLRPIASLSMLSAHILGHLHHHALTQKHWSEKHFDIIKQILTSDPRRQNIQKYWYSKHPELHCGGITYGWYDEAVKSCEILDNSTLYKNFDIPLLFAIAEKDKVVSNTAIQRIAAMIPHAETYLALGAQHVLHAERDEIRKPFLHAFDIFVQKHLP